MNMFQQEIYQWPKDALDQKEYRFSQNQKRIQTALTMALPAFAVQSIKNKIQFKIGMKKFVLFWRRLTVESGSGQTIALWV